MTRVTIIEKTNPLIGVLLFLGLAMQSQALDSPREILIEVDRPVVLLQRTDGTHTGRPDLDAFLSLHPEAVTRYALELPEGRHTSFKRYLILRLSSDQEAQVPTFIQKIAQLSSVRWAQPHRLLRSHFYPNDPLFPDQWGLEKVQAEDAWDVTLGSESIPIAIIDTGCEMDHPDLTASLWNNPGEDADSNGVLDDSDIDGIDNDGNGFIDDFYGWDFVDAPTFPTSGDYLDRDNDPSDEMGHGTAVAGVCGAVIHNDLGIAGLAPDCPLMILRAGNMNGFLQEDDVASAILYALDNGARIANMSFGDVQVSPMLEDVINYASQGGLLMVAAAGNDYEPGMIAYPAALSPTLCVGACNPSGGRANFSNSGPALDLIAPGEDILSTWMGHSYQSESGTSFAAPFTSAAAGLVLSEHSELEPAEVISVLKSSADDIGPPGWDWESGQGILRADKAVQIGDVLVAEITSPAMNQGFDNLSNLNIIGTAAGVYLQQYGVYTGIGENPSEWETVIEARIQVLNGLLATWKMEEPPDTADTIYTILLTARDIAGIQIEDRVIIHFDPTPPVISDITLVPILDADRPSYLISFTTDDLTTGKVWLQGQTSPEERWISIPLGYQATDHIILLGEDLPYKKYEYSISVVNSAGQQDSTGSLGTLDLDAEPITTNYFVEMPSSEIPPSQFYEETTDLDGDGFLEVWVDTLDAGGGRSNLRVYEATASWTFSDLGLDFGREIPKSIGDSDEDDFMELLTLYAGRSTIFEATQSPGFPQPSNIAWADSDGVWGARLLDLESGDGHGEVLLASKGIYQLYLNWGGGVLDSLQSLPNPFNPDPDPSTTFPPYCRINDYDGDGYIELLFGDYDGNLFIYERQPNDMFELSWSFPLPLLDTGEFLSDGDYDGDGTPEFAALAHTETSLAGEHLAGTRYWALYIFRNDGNDQYSTTDTLYFFGAENPMDFASGISSGDVYGSSRPEILLCLYPDFYVVSCNSLTDEFSVIWYYPECRSNKALVGDFNGNGHDEILFNGSTSVKIFEEVGDWSYALPPPLNFTAVPEPDRVNLSWTPILIADRYNLKRGDSPITLELLFEILDPQDSTYTDFEVEKDTTYYYAISTVNLTSPSPEGPTSVPIAATPNDPPYVVGDTAHFDPPNFVTVQFSEPMGPSLLDPSNYWITSGSLQPNSVASGAGGEQAVLTFEPVFTESEYHLIIHKIYDLQGSVLSTIYDTLRFTVPLEEHRLPYLVAANPNAGFSVLTLVFSDAMDSTDLSEEENYSITVDPVTGVPSPDHIAITEAEPDASLPNFVHLQINPSTPIGPLGKIYRVKVDSLHSAAGVLIDPDHNTVTLNFYSNNLDHVFVYPNPYKTGSLVDGERCVVFANLTQNAEIHILNLSGIVIKTLKAAGNVTGGIRWYLDNDRGERVGSGIYLYYVTGGGDTFWGKLAVVR